MMQDIAKDTIFAVATPPGNGGIGVIRISGPGTRNISTQVLGFQPEARHAHMAHFQDAHGETIDTGLALFFPAPRSLTGEDVLELQGHGGAVVLKLLADRLSALGARAARPGEFLERAYLNDKIDLTQAEAIADLIESGTEAAARAARRSMEGVFSDRVQALQGQLTTLRVFVEAALDFPDEDIDFIADSDVDERLESVLAGADELIEQAHQGHLLRDGITIAIFGQPNAGKSSLLNALSGRDSAIVTDIPGTTRDVLRETLQLRGYPVHIADTAGIRDATDAVEAEGVKRARHALSEADLALLVIDSQAPVAPQQALVSEVPEGIDIIEAINKIDLAAVDWAETERTDAREAGGSRNRRVPISARTGEGLEELISTVLTHAGAQSVGHGSFSARTRHVEALKRTRDHLRQGREQLTGFSAAETLAEELRLAQRALGEITGEFLPDDLLGAIFADFCIGK